jgi:hypothetical protein
MQAAPFIKVGKDWSFGTNARNSDFGEIISRLGRNFIRCQRDYIRCFKDDEKAWDMGYFYNERTNIGFLAAAAWRQRGWVALEEFRFDKKHRTEKGKVSKGRADLYIGIREGNASCISLSIEAKQTFVGSARAIAAQLNIKKADSALSLAILDARHSVREVDHRCAAVFVCVSLLKNEHYEKHDQEIGEAFYDCCATLRGQWGAFAFFPAEDFAWDKNEKGFERKYPAIGVVILRL